MSGKDVLCNMIMRIKNERALTLIFYFVRNFINKEDKTA